MQAKVNNNIQQQKQATLVIIVILVSDGFLFRPDPTLYSFVFRYFCYKLNSIHSLKFKQPNSTVEKKRPKLAAGNLKIRLFHSLKLTKHFYGRKAFGINDF